MPAGQDPHNISDQSKLAASFRYILEPYTSWPTFKTFFSFFLKIKNRTYFTELAKNYQNV